MNAPARLDLSPYFEALRRIDPLRWSGRVAEVAGLLGCGVMAGLGAALNTGNVTRGDSVAVIGCGGVGDAAILGASLAGASKIMNGPRIGSSR